jgi:DNA-binding response OmpR family regulator
LPVLVLSARIETSARERAINAGADGFLTKPVQFRELLSEMTRLLTSPRELPQVAAIPEPPTVAPPAAPTAAPITESPAAPPAEATNNTPVDPASKPQLPTSDAPQATMPSDPADPGVKPQ